MIPANSLKNQLTKIKSDYLKDSKKIINKSFHLAKKKDENYNEILKMATPDTVTSNIYSYAKKNKIKLSGMASFRRSLSIRHFSRQIQPKPREWILNDKEKGFKFSDSIGIKRPNVFFQGCLNDALKYLKPGMVLKPLGGAGSIGVYIFKYNGEIYSVKNSRTLTFDTLIDEVKKGIVTAKFKDCWIVEELIAETSNASFSRDLKFYCFYGKCGVILEVKRDPVIEHCFWLPSGNLANTGKYIDSSFIGQGVTAKQVEMAEFISSKIPAPFMRIDFLKSYKDNCNIALGEFTPSPGTYEDFSEKFDQYLGELYLSAEARLFDDLLDGRSFSEFTSL